LYVLIDFLTANHREFRSRYMPDVSRMLETLKAEFSSDPDPIQAVIFEFNEFRRDFSWHMQEEEEFFFPKILRTEASLHHPDLYPEIFKGSLTIYPKSILRAHEETFSEIIRDLTGKLKGMVFEMHQLPMVKSILTSLQGHDAGLKAHAILETEVLFPLGAEMERKLQLRAREEGAAR
jgi:iron-sulfur cluster repair protein YtfE (RIC family)